MVKYLTEDIRHLRMPLVLLGIYCLLVFPMFHCFCPMVIFLGIPCPACGMTRAALLLFGGHVREAAEMNPCIFIWIPYLAGFLLIRCGYRKKFPAGMAFTILTGIATIVIYGIRMATGHWTPVAYHGLVQYLFLQKP